MHIRRGDTVLVLTGKDRGLRGKVVRALPKENRAVVEGVNKVKRHQKPTPSNPQGGIITREAPIHASNLMLVCPHCHKPTRIAHRVDEQGNRTRACKRCGAVVDAK
ncbi:MAG: 50S ribosomal protein L24 [Firmicutes bacterium]|nr:50S ribosomal protein L24 [Bacillota bacterium]